MEVKFPYNPVCLCVSRLVGQSKFQVLLPMLLSENLLLLLVAKDCINLEKLEPFWKTLYLNVSTNFRLELRAVC